MLFAKSAHAKDGHTDCTEDNRSHRYVIRVLGRALCGLGCSGGGRLHRGRCVGADTVGVLVRLISMMEMVLACTAVTVSALAVRSPGMRKRRSGKQTQGGKERRKATKTMHKHQLLYFYHTTEAKGTKREQEEIGMSEKEKQLAETIAKTLVVLPEEAKAHWMGYAEGVADMAQAMKTQRKEEEKET